MKLQRPDPGIDAAKSGLHGKAGIFFNAGLLEKGEPRFDLQDLDPYLVFDSRESMLGTLENPTLDLDPATPSTLDVITATRAGVATYTDPDGNIATASADTVRVDYTQGAELTPTVYQRIGYTDFSSGWTNTNTSSEDGAGYLGQPSKIITANSVSNVLYYFKLNTGTYLLNTLYTGSFWIRRVSGTPNVYVDFYRSSSTQSPSIAVSDEWQQVAFTFTSPSDYWTRFGINFVNGSSIGDQVEIAMPQVEEGTTATDFVANTTGSPKFITGATYADRVPMILVEPSATNLVPYSEDFSNSDWDNNGSILQNEAISPDGTQNADLFYSTSTANGRRALEIKTIASGQYYTASVFAKAKNKDFIYFTDIDNQVNSVWFDIKSGTFSTPVEGEALIEDYGNGWFRCSLTTQSSGVNGHCYIGVSDSSGSTLFTTNGTDGVYIWGAQVEAGSVATSYIPTSGGNAAARTRAADDLVISGSDFSDFYNQSEGTMYVESTPFQETGYIWSINDGSYSNRIYSMFDSSVRTRHYVRVGGTFYFENIASPSALGEISRNAFSFKTNNAISSVDGTSSPPDSSVTLPSGLNRLTIGQTAVSDFTLNGHIKRLIYWPYHSDSL